MKTQVKNRLKELQTEYEHFVELSMELDETYQLTDESASVYYKTKAEHYEHQMERISKEIIELKKSGNGIKEKVLVAGLGLTGTIAVALLVTKFEEDNVITSTVSKFI